MYNLLLVLMCFVNQGFSRTFEPGKSVQIPSGKYVPFFSPKKKLVKVKSFKLDAYQVTQREFLEFLKFHPEWRRSQIKPIFADKDYLKNWPDDFRVEKNNLPVTYVSWFAAKAYCEWSHKRLPTQDEWEYVAQANEHKVNALSEPKFKRRILQWYNQPTPEVLPEVGKGFRNVYGVFGMHGLVWEWVFDFNSTLINDGRVNGGKLPKNLFCGGGAVGAADSTDYAAFMRFAFRSSLKGSYTVKNLGFRCAQGGL